MNPRVLASNHGRLAQSSALQEGAESLLVKALDALDAGDRATAEQRVRRALRLPFDDYEEVTPAWWRAYMLLFAAIVEEWEDGEGEDWLDAALAAEEQLEVFGRHAVRSTLTVLEADYELDRDASRRIRAHLGGVQPLIDWQDLLPEGDEAPVAAILQVLAAYNAYDDALGARSGS
ncbi:MAG: hypothetical protein WAL50_10965 [Kineosporiaceae bacterium]